MLQKKDNKVKQTRKQRYEFLLNPAKADKHKHILHVKFIRKTKTKTPRHVRDKTSSRTCQGLRTYVMRGRHARVEVFLTGF